jgi:hypothetical protein
VQGNQSNVVSSARRSAPTRSLRLRERVNQDLTDKFRDRFVQCATRDFSPDLVIAQGQRVAVIEIKTGDSTLPLPSSANAQMLILKDGARTRFEGAEVVPVLVTNYLVDDADRKELKDGRYPAPYDTKLYL